MSRPVVRGRLRDDARARDEGFVFDSSRWDSFERRPGDIIICTPPKCGTTWTQMICALLVLQVVRRDSSRWGGLSTETVDRTPRRHGVATPPNDHAKLLLSTRSQSGVAGRSLDSAGVSARPLGS
jgi:hypothetical protein